MLFLSFVYLMFFFVQYFLLTFTLLIYFTVIYFFHYILTHAIHQPKNNNPLFSCRNVLLKRPDDILEFAAGKFETHKFETQSFQDCACDQRLCWFKTRPLWGPPQGAHVPPGECVPQFENNFHRNKESTGRDTLVHLVSVFLFVFQITSPTQTFTSTLPPRWKKTVSWTEPQTTFTALFDLISVLFYVEQNTFEAGQSFCLCQPYMIAIYWASAQGGCNGIPNKCDETLMSSGNPMGFTHC